MSERDPNERGALWEKTSAKGVYMTGTIDGKPCVIFKNARKDAGSKAPDWRVLTPTKREARPERPDVGDMADLQDDGPEF
jgi:hypothetical protein